LQDLLDHLFKSGIGGKEYIGFLYGIGIFFYNNERYDITIKCQNKILEINPEDPIAYSIRGLAYAKNMKFDRAIEDYTKAIELRSKYIGAEDKIVSAITKRQKKYKYDIAISFARENREIAKNLVEELHNIGVRVFYDKFYKTDLWGKKLTKYFRGVYGSYTRFVVILLSKDYPARDWTDFEFSVVRDEAKRRKTEFILPIKLDDTKMLGIHEDVGYLDYRKEGIKGIVNAILEKLSN